MTSEIRRFPLPASHPSSNLNTAVFDRRGTLWFTGQAGVYGSLVPFEFRALPLGAAAAEFRAVLSAAKLPSHRRYSGGGDVGAACGQLANTVPWASR